jgi:hypothetical protein
VEDHLDVDIDPSMVIIDDDEKYLQSLLKFV